MAYEKWLKRKLYCAFREISKSSASTKRNNFIASQQLRHVVTLTASSFFWYFTLMLKPHRGATTRFDVCAFEPPKTGLTQKDSTFDFVLRPPDEKNLRVACETNKNLNNDEIKLNFYS